MAAPLTSRIGCIVLAAGEGRRFGGQKLLASVGGEPLLQRAIDAACGADVLTCTLIVGADAERTVAAVNTRRCNIAFNRAWRDGLSASIRCGLRTHADDDACIMLLGDQPFVTTTDLDRLIATWSGRIRSTEQPKAWAPIVALRAGDVWGSPMLFPRRDFAALRKLTGDIGAKRYAEQQKERLLFVDAADARAFTDIDTRTDLSRLNVSRTRQIRRSRSR